MASDPSPKSRAVALALAILLGPFGAHRFYLGRTDSGVLMALTLGGLGLWYLYDVIVIAAGAFPDAEGRLVTRWEPRDEGGPDRPAVSQAVLDELEALRRDLLDLQERVDFTERLLAATRDPPAAPRPPGAVTDRRT